MGTSRERTEDVYGDIRRPHRSIIYYLHALIWWMWRIKPCAPLFLFLLGCNPPLTPSPAGLVLAPLYHLESQDCDEEFKEFISYAELPADGCERITQVEFECSDCSVTYIQYNDDLY